MPKIEFFASLAMVLIIPEPERDPGIAKKEAVRLTIRSRCV
jgi:hypothetical protein